MPQRHATDVISLIFGLIFAGTVAVCALAGADAIDLGQVGLAGPAVLIAAGVIGLIAALRGSGQRDVRD